VSKTTRKLRLRGIAAATALALAGPALAGQVHLDGLQSDAQFDRFIVKFRDSAPEAREAAALQSSLRQASAAAHQMIEGQRLQAGGRAGAAKPFEVGHLRRLSVGGDVVRASRKLDREGAEALMRQLAANPNVEYVEVDQLMRAIYTPNDTNYGQQWGYSASRPTRPGTSPMVRASWSRCSTPATPRTPTWPRTPSPATT
jgi:serine protease